METLSSCYFCGTALDEPVEEYSVVPKAFGSDGDGPKVALCPSCHEKLDVILEAVVSSVKRSDRQRDRDVETDDGVTRGAAARSTDEKSDGDDGPETALTGDDSERDEQTERTTDADTRTADHAPSAADPLADDADGVRSEPMDDVAGPTDAHGDDGGTGHEARADGETEDDGDDADAVVDQSLTALEYNKVMRLVQNREFPLDRAEIESVASNAYGIPRRDCARILDAAIERGLLAERDGQLLNPDE